MLATYPGGNTIGAEPREMIVRADGYHHIDTPTTIAQVKRLHANTYVYLVWHAPSVWSDLTHDFLPAAHQAGDQRLGLRGPADRVLAGALLLPIQD